MNTTRQVVRWTIPGTVLVLVAVTVRATACRALDCENLLPLDAPIVIASVLPIGFVLFQLYFFGYHRGRRWATPIDRGARILRHVRATAGEAIINRLADAAGWDATQLEPLTEPWEPSIRGRRLGSLRLHLHRLRDSPEASRGLDDRVGRQEAPAPPGDMADFSERHANNMAAMLLLLDAIPDGAVPSRQRLREEYVSLSDIYHSQGAARSASAYGTFAALAVSNPLVHDGDWWLWLAFAGTSGIVAGLLFFVLHRARHHTLLRLIATMGYGLAHALRSAEDPP